MLSKKVAWDVAELEFQYDQINQYLGKIREELEEEESLRELIETSFQTPAGEMYRQHLTGTVHVLLQIVEEVETLLLDLRKVISNCYETCESEVGPKVQILISSLQ